MVKKKISQFDKLISNIGKVVVAEYISSYRQYLAEGQLLRVNPFTNITINRKQIPFIGTDSSIKTVLDEEGEILFHNPYIISHPETEEEYRWTKYYSGFLEEDLEEREIESKNSLITKIRQFEKKKSYIKIEGGKIVKPELRKHWDHLCNYKHFLLYILEPALEVMRELVNGFHKELSEVDEKYGLSGYQFNTMVNAINFFSPRTHPVAEHYGKKLDQMRSR